MKLDTSQKIFAALTVVGAAAFVVGAVMSRRRGALAGVLGDMKRQSGFGVGTFKRGQTVEHYAPFMPIKKRVKLAQKLVELSIKDETMGPQMRKLALQITSGCPARDDTCEARSIYNWVRQRIRYTGDVAPFQHSDGRVEAVDLFQSAYKTLDFRGGDCDDHSILVASLLLLNGIPAKFRITAPRGSGEWSHIYTLAGLPKTDPKRWVAVDTTLPGGDRFGYEAPYSKRIDFVA